MRILAIIVATFFSSLAFAEKVPCGPDIVGCPGPYVTETLTCDPDIEIYDLVGYLDRFIEFMRKPAVACEYNYSDYTFDWLVALSEEESSGCPVIIPEGSEGNGAECGELRKITLRPLSGGNITTTEVIAKQRYKHERRAKVRGCFVNPELFLVEWIGFDRPARRPASNP